MSHYLVLYVDLNYVVGVVYNANCNKSVSISTESGENTLDLYFYNDPYNSQVSFKNSYKQHFLNGEVNYFGDFMRNILDEGKHFILNNNRIAFIELLKMSGILALLKSDFSKHTKSEPDSYPTLISFSRNVSSQAKLKLVDYLKRENFAVDSFAIPLSVLVANKLLADKKIQGTSLKKSVFIESTNSYMNLSLLNYVSNFFHEEKGKEWIVPDKGYDPRRAAIINYVVAELNKSLGILATEAEINHEKNRLVNKAEEWLQRLDEVKNRPLRLSVNFSIAPNNRRDVLVIKSNIEKETNLFVDSIVAEYTAYVSDYIKKGERIEHLFLVGDCFNNEVLLNKFEGKANRVININTKSLQSLISYYTRIDCSKYVQDEKDIAKLADIEAKNNAKLKKQQDEVDRIKRQREESDETENTKIENAKLAQKYYDQAKILISKERFQEAKVYLEDALSKKPLDDEISLTYVDIIHRIAERDNQLNSYKKLLEEGDKQQSIEEYENALVKYEVAYTLLPNDDLKSKIDEVRILIRKRLEDEKDFQACLVKADEYQQQWKYHSALQSLEKAQKIKPGVSTVEIKIIELRALLKQQVENIKKLKQEAQEALNTKKYEKAIKLYRKIAEIDESFQNVEEKITNIESLIEVDKLNENKYKEIIGKVVEFEAKQNYHEGLLKLEEALAIRPKDAYCISKKAELKRLVETVENKYAALLFEAEEFRSIAEVRKALELLYEAQAVKNTVEVVTKIKELEFEMNFEGHSNYVPDNITSTSLKQPLNSYHGTTTAANASQVDDFLSKNKSGNTKKSIGSKDSGKQENSKDILDVFFEKKQPKYDSRNNAELDEFAFGKSGGRQKPRENKDDFLPKNTVRRTSNSRKDEVDEFDFAKTKNKYTSKPQEDNFFLD